jgi:hypothetical protein
MNTTTCTCNCGGDSPLSLASNIIGLLTFVLATFISIIGWLELTSGAAEEITTFSEELQRTRDSLVPFLHFWGTKQLHSKDPIEQNCAATLENAAQALISIIEPVYKDLKMTKSLGGSSWSPFNVYRRFVWISKRTEFAERMTRIRNLKNEMMFSQLDLLLQ